VGAGSEEQKLVVLDWAHFGHAKLEETTHLGQSLLEVVVYVENEPLWDPYSLTPNKRAIYTSTSPSSTSPSSCTWLGRTIVLRP